ncbi:MAG: MltA domain-containing protein [Magnetococcales bacterium]|nr:MltA domain-containing protein [Magnetococcales bacterium]
MSSDNRRGNGMITVVIMALIVTIAVLLVLLFEERKARDPVPISPPTTPAPTPPPTPPEPPEKKSAVPPLKPIAWGDLLQQLQEDQEGFAQWLTAIEGSLGYYRKVAKSRVFSYGIDTVTANDLVVSLEKMLKDLPSLDIPERLTYLQEHFQLYMSIGREEKGGDVLVTAYYEPLLYGSMQRSEMNHYPLYKRPDDLVTAQLSDWSSDWRGKRLFGHVVDGRYRPYHSRSEIDDKGKLEKRGFELVWVEDQIDAFFLHIQGSGRVQLPDGKMLRVGYHGANGHVYRSIGKLLIREGAIPRKKMSLQALKTWLKKHPDQVSRVLNYNPSYVFFRELDGGPYGNIQVGLTPERSIATDHRLFPKGAPAILTTRMPTMDEDGTLKDWKSTTRLMVNQDTGGAIRGPGRVDLFMGFGQRAETIAGNMKQAGSELYFLAPLQGLVRGVDVSKKEVKKQN